MGAAGGDVEPTYGPDPEQYAAFAKQAAAHYSALGVHAYEVWNEPNAKAFWTPAPDVGGLHGAAEGRLSGDQGGRPAGDRAHRRHRSGADRRRGHHSRSGSCAASTRPAAAAHSTRSPITLTAGRPIPATAEDWSAWYQMYGTNPSLRSVMTDNGDAGKKIWATEFGAPTNGPAGSHVSEGDPGEDADARATRSGRATTGSGPLFSLSGSRPRAPTRSTREDFFGLLRADWSPKPAFDAYRNCCRDRNRFADRRRRRRPT